MRQSLEYTVSKLTFFAASRQKCANLPSLKSPDSVIIADTETVRTDLQKANTSNIKNIDRVNPLSIQ
jgi:hypothetical protein